MVENNFCIDDLENENLENEDVKIDDWENSRLDSNNKTVDIIKQNRWIDYLVKLQSIAQNGLAYCNNEFDLERYTELRELSALMMSDLTNLPIEKVKNVFLNETGYQTPKLVSRTAIFKGDKILLVQENYGLWTLPGGWCEVNVSLKDNAMKEVKEESGIDCEITKLIAILDGNKYREAQTAYGVCIAFFIAEEIGGKFVENIETIDSAYFPLDELPEIDESKVSLEQIKMCFKAREESWEVLVD